MKAIEQMTKRELQKWYEKLSSESSRITDEFIATGRGYELPSEYPRKDDPLSLRARANCDGLSAIRYEVERRFGPGVSVRHIHLIQPKRRINWCAL